MLKASGSWSTTSSSSRRRLKRSSSPGQHHDIEREEARLYDLRRRQENLSQSPELLATDLNGSPGSFSHQQILQMYNAGLPYLHLLNPALRNGNGNGR